jgi:hypothetical protein
MSLHNAIYTLPAGASFRPRLSVTGEAVMSQNRPDPLLSLFRDSSKMKVNVGNINRVKMIDWIAKSQLHEVYEP